MQASADVLTGDPNAALEVRFFAAQTLCQKVRRQLSTLSEGDIVPLQSSLEKCIYTSAGGPMPILAQLCAAMATLIVQRPEAGGPLDVLSKLLNADLPTGDGDGKETRGKRAWGKGGGPGGYTLLLCLR